MRYFNRLSGVIALVILAGCATAPDVHSPGDTSARIGSSETFALIPVTVDPKVSAAVASAAIEAAENGARDTLKALGYSETSREKADLVFYLHGKSLAPVAVTEWNYQPAPSQFGLSPHDVEVWSNHRIYVETYDNHSKQQIWMGWIECSCAGVNPERIQHEIQRIVATFPPRSKA